MRCKALLALSVVVGAALPLSAQSSKPPAIRLPPPRTEIGVPLMEALKKRHSSREFSPDPIPPEVLSDLLWAAFGVNRPGPGLRTAPSASDWQEIDIYVATKQGVYLYDAFANRLKPLFSGDIRPSVPIQEYPATAPLILIYVADFNRMTRATDKDRVFYSACDAGFISQDVYLYCASEGINTTVIGLIRRRDLRKALKLNPDQKIILAQPIGYPPDQPQGP